MIFPIYRCGNEVTRCWRNSPRATQRVSDGAGIGHSGVGYVFLTTLLDHFFIFPSPLAQKTILLPMSLKRSSPFNTWAFLATFSFYVMYFWPPKPFCLPYFSLRKWCFPMSHWAGLPMCPQPWLSLRIQAALSSFHGLLPESSYPPSSGCFLPKPSAMHQPPSSWNSCEPLCITSIECFTWFFLLNYVLNSVLSSGAHLDLPQVPSLSSMACVTFHDSELLLAFRAHCLTVFITLFLPCFLEIMPP